MNELTPHMRAAMERVRDLPDDQQDLLARELLDRASILSGAPTHLSDAERAELAAELAAARRGERSGPNVGIPRSHSGQGGILAALRRSPLVGADLDLSRPLDAGRKVDL